MAWHYRKPIRHTKGDRPQLQKPLTIPLENMREEYPSLCARLLHGAYPYLSALHCQVLIDSRADLTLWPIPATDAAIKLVRAVAKREALAEAAERALAAGVVLA
jgi:hypothetical protein